jgi:ABC-type multidrug transport system permease subunit
MALTPEKKQQIEEISRDIGEALGTLVGSLIANAIFAGILYAILHYLIGIVAVTYLQVFGAILLLNFIKNLIQK